MLNLKTCLIVVLILPLFSCASENHSELSELGKDKKQVERSIQEKLQFIDRELNVLKTRLLVLRREVSNSNSEAVKELTQKISTLEKLKYYLQKKYLSIKYATDDNWVFLKDQINLSFNELEKII